MKVLLLLGVALSGLAIAACVPDKVVCYYGGWAVYRPGNGKFDVENIDPFVCTHLIYSFVGLAESGEIVVLDPWIDLEDNWGRGAYKRFNNLKKVNPDLKTLIAIGGWNEGSMKYSKTFRDPSKIAVFVQSAVNFVRTHGFDGLDLDWEYPNQRGGEPVDVDNFSALLRALRTEFDKHGYLLTAAVAAAEKSFSLSYDVPQLSQNLDFINIMAYDFHGAWENITGHNAPIYISSVEEGTEIAGYNADASIQAWIDQGASPEKLILGVGLYGRAFTLRSTSCNGPRCPASGAANAGPFTREVGMLGYNEICVTETGDATALKFWDEEAKVPYMSWGNQWVGYDNELSAKLKVDYIKKHNLGGAMVWSIDTDDFLGICGKGRFPLLNVLKNELGISPSGTTTPAPTTAAPTTAAPTTAAPTTAAPTTAAPTTAEPSTDPSAAPTTAAPTTAAPTTAAPTTATPTTAAPGTVPQTEKCKFEGYNRDPDNCRIFYQCYVANGAYKHSTFTCREGLAFDLTRNICNYASEVDC